MKIMKQWHSNQKGSSSIEAALIIPMILVMHFFIVGGFIWYAESVHFEIFWNARDLKMKNTYENGEVWFKRYGDVNHKNQKIPFVGEIEMQHQNSSFGGPLYETIRLARMGETLFKEDLKRENPSR